ncbi:MAG: hypothetical protein P8P36_07030 [Akkermansiaceae bacterium]|nr:hypothetical protein [Akkermansiaceae bacterium]
MSAAEDVVTKSGGADAATKNVPSTLFGNISVSGGNQQVRGGIASAANDLRVQFNKLCGDPDRKMKLPMIIKLHGVEGDKELPRSIVSKISSLQGQYQLLLHIHLAKGVDQYFLRYHLMELLLYERGLANDQFVDEGDRLTVKPWLIIGMLEAIDIRSADYDRRIYQSGIDFLSVLSFGKVFEMTENQWRELIGHEPIAFRAIAGAIVNSLLRQPGGKSGMSTYLADFATFKGEYENLLRQHFPGMNKSTNSLGKWVNLELLELSTAQVTQVHSILETESRLDGVLKLHYRDAEGFAHSVGVDAYDAILELEPKQRFEAVAAARAELERLSYRCFPTYRPILNEYELILRELVNGGAKNTRPRLTSLMDVRTRMKAAAARSRDYLDWYYITQSRELSGDFDKYRALNDAIQKEVLRPAADDTTGNYLDQIQRIYGSKY